MTRWDPKDPVDVDWFELDWSDLLDTGDTIDTVEWSVPGGLTEVEGSAANTDTTTVIKLGGGTAGVRYRVEATVVTSAGRTLNRGQTLSVLDL